MIIPAPDERSLQIDLVRLDWMFRSRAGLEAEILILRHQLNARDCLDVAGLPIQRLGCARRLIHSLARHARAARLDS